MSIEKKSKKVTNKQGIEIVTNYKDAVDWLHNNYILCNNIPEIDTGVYDNMRFDNFDKETEELTDIYQWFLTDASERDVEYLEKRFNLKFTYSDLLGCFVLCVTHYGTAWEYVFCPDKLMDSKAKKELKGY